MRNLALFGLLALPLVAAGGCGRAPEDPAERMPETAAEKAAENAAENAVEKAAGKAADEQTAEPLPRLAGRTITGGCRQDQCRWLRVIDVTSAARVPQGELRRMTVRVDDSLHRDGIVPDRAEDARIEWHARDTVDYAFCSVQRPAFAFERDTGGLIVHFLDLFDPAGYQYASAERYMRLCHDRDQLPDGPELRRLGYRPGTRSEQVEDATPETMTRF